MLSESVDRQQTTMNKVRILTILVVLKCSRLHIKFQGYRSFWFWRRRFLKVFTIYGCGGHFGHVTKPSCVNFSFHYFQKLSHDIWFQITDFEKTRLNFEDVVTFGKGQIITLAFDIHVASFNHLV